MGTGHHAPRVLYATRVRKPYGRASTWRQYPTGLCLGSLGRCAPSRSSAQVRREDGTYGPNTKAVRPHPPRRIGKAASRWRRVGRGVDRPVTRSLPCPTQLRHLGVLVERDAHEAAVQRAQGPIPAPCVAVLTVLPAPADTRERRPVRSNRHASSFAATVNLMADRYGRSSTRPRVFRRRKNTVQNARRPRSHRPRSEATGQHARSRRKPYRTPNLYALGVVRARFRDLARRRAARRSGPSGATCTG